MELETIRELKNQLEIDMMQLVSKFYRETNLKIKKIYLETISEGYLVVYVPKVELEEI
jgi:hypothetical protein